MNAIIVAEGLSRKKRETRAGGRKTFAIEARRDLSDNKRRGGGFQQGKKRGYRFPRTSTPKPLLGRKRKEAISS